MTNRGHALSRDELIRALTSYSGITTADGNPGGTTLIDANLIGRNDFITEKAVLLMSGDAALEDKGASSFNTVTGQITLQSAVSAQIKAGIIFRILNISSIEMDVDAINTKIGTNVDAAGTTTLFAWMAKLFASGTAIAGAVSDAGPATTDFDTDLTEATNEHYRGLFLMFLDGVCAGQGHTIDSYTGATKNAAFAVGDTFTAAPANGDNFVILPAEGRLLQLIDAAVAALMADVGDASAATLGSLLGILGDPAQTFLAMIGYEGATSLANKLTAARAALLDQITALRMAELDPAGIPADVAAVAVDVAALGLTTYDQETAGATDVNGNTWKDLLDKSVITVFTEIWGIQTTKGGTWAGLPQIRITDGAGTKIFPFAAQAEEGTDFIDTIVWMFAAPVCVPIADGYKVQFRSTNGADGAGETLAINELDIIERG